VLRQAVQAMLDRRYSPEQAAGRLDVLCPGEAAMHVSHERSTLSPLSPAHRSPLTSFRVSVRGSLARFNMAVSGQQANPGDLAMTEQDEQEQRESWNALGIRTDIPHPARVYDYMLGGKDNFAADRETAERSLQLVPEMLDSSRGNRDFLVRAVEFLRDEGIRQFLDIGTGLPTSPNTHETAQEGHPDARVVYVDNDPVVFLHAEALMANNATTAVVRADLRDVDEVLAKAGELLDFTKPVALMFVAVLHCVEDEDDPAAIAARYLAALAPGSYLVISHSTDEFAPERTHQASAEAKKRGAIWIPRSKEAILRMFNDREPIDPGLVLVSRWRPEGGVPGPNADRAWAYGGVATI
jgi:SAM-dependent methyltransferase